MQNQPDWVVEALNAHDDTETETECHIERARRLNGIAETVFGEEESALLVIELERDAVQALWMACAAHINPETTPAQYLLEAGALNAVLAAVARAIRPEKPIESPDDAHWRVRATLAEGRLCDCQKGETHEA
jgi:hypothetical protein